MAFSLVKRGLFKINLKIYDRSFIPAAGILDNSLNFEKKKVHSFTPRYLNGAINQIDIKDNDDFLSRKLIVSIQNVATRQYSKKSSKHERDYNSDSDSDSEDEIDRNRKGKKGQEQRGNTEFWRRKMRTLHAILDINNDGVISFDDFMLLAKKFTDLGHLQPATSTEFLNVMKKSWEEQWGEITPYNLVTAEQYLTDMHHTLNDKELVKKIGRFLPYFFKAVDIDNSGYLDLEQFKLFFNCLGLTDENAAVSFAVIDKNGDGKLTLKEFVKLGKDYFLTENEARVSKWFWGPLVAH